MRCFLTIITVLIASTSVAQIKFSESTFDNGMLYPVAEFPDNPTIADSMNAIIQRNLNDAEGSDFCIGDFGYFQKGNHIELHLVCNCIDFTETDHRYLFFSLETGTLVGYTDLFDSKERDKAIKAINRLIKAADQTKTCAGNFAATDAGLEWSDMKFRLYKDGLEVYPTEGACENPVQIPWTEISTYLRYSFL